MPRLPIPTFWKKVFFTKKLYPFIIRFFIIFERFFPTFFLIFSKRYLESLVSEGKISGYQISAVRQGRLTYKIDFRLVMTDRQVNLLFDSLINMLVDSIKNLQGTEEHVRKR